MASQAADAEAPETSKAPQDKPQEDGGGPVVRRIRDIKDLTWTFPPCYLDWRLLAVIVLTRLALEFFLLLPAGIGMTKMVYKLLMLPDMTLKALSSTYFMVAVGGGCSPRVKYGFTAGALVGSLLGHFLVNAWIIGFTGALLVFSSLSFCFNFVVLPKHLAFIGLYTAVLTGATLMVEYYALVVRVVGSVLTPVVTLTLGLAFAPVLGSFMRFLPPFGFYRFGTTQVPAEVPVAMFLYPKIFVEALRINGLCNPTEPLVVRLATTSVGVIITEAITRSCLLTRMWRALAPGFSKKRGWDTIHFGADMSLRCSFLTACPAVVASALAWLSATVRGAPWSDPLDWGICLACYFVLNLVINGATFLIFRFLDPPPLGESMLASYRRITTEPRQMCKSLQPTDRPTDVPECSTVNFVPRVSDGVWILVFLWFMTVGICRDGVTGIGGTRCYTYLHPDWCLT